jgi:drug/metabolite transporter (DMT)-like permease
LSRKPTALTWLAFAAVCVFWGTTANAIRVGVRAIPPVSLSGARFLTAGSLLLAALLCMGRRLPKSRSDWGFLLAGGLGLALANATLNAGFTQVESGMGSLLVSSNALWIALMEAAWPGGQSPRPLAWAGLGLGFAGVALLALGQGLGGADLPHLGLMLASAFFWAATIVVQHRWSRRQAVPEPLLAAALQMLIAGPLLLLAGWLLGERLAWPVPAGSLAGFAWLVVFGSLVGYVAYQSIIGRLSVAALGLVPLVNPLVAVAIGCWLLGERLGGQAVAAGLMILAGVALVQRAER